MIKLLNLDIASFQDITGGAIRKLTENFGNELLNTTLCGNDALNKIGPVLCL